MSSGGSGGADGDEGSERHAGHMYGGQPRFKQQAVAGHLGNLDVAMLVIAIRVEEVVGINKLLLLVAVMQAVEVVTVDLVLAV